MLRQVWRVLKLIRLKEMKYLALGQKKESISLPAPSFHSTQDQVTTTYTLEYCQQPPSLWASRVAAASIHSPAYN